MAVTRNVKKIMMFNDICHHRLAKSMTQSQAGTYLVESVFAH